MAPEKTTALICTFQRPECAERLVAQIHERFPLMPIIVIDDSNEPRPIPDTHYVHTDFDIGVGAKRNLGVSLTQTKYVFHCDDDNVLIPESLIGEAEHLLEESGVDLLGLKEVNNEYYGVFATDGETVRYLRQDLGTVGGVTLYDFVPNLWIARVKALKVHPWDEDLKTGEHFAFFYQHNKKLKVGFTDQVQFGHAPMTNPVYASHRDRAGEFVKQFMRKQGIKRRIDLAGNVVEV